MELNEAKKTYDRVFDPSATQQQVFDYVAKPLVSGEWFELSLVLWISPLQPCVSLALLFSPLPPLPPPLALL